MSFNFTQFALGEYKKHQEYYLHRQDTNNDIVILLLWQKYCATNDVYSSKQSLIPLVKLLYFMFVVPLRLLRRKFYWRRILKLEIAMEMLLIKLLSYNTEINHAKNHRH